MHDIDLMLKLQLEGKHSEARKISDKLEELGPDKIPTSGPEQTKEDVWMRHCFNRGWYLIQEGEYQKGSQLLDCGRYLNVYGSPPIQTTAPIFNPSKDSLVGKSIIISLEGGYGDEIIHARFASSFKKQGAKKVYLAAAPELVSVFSRIEGVDGVILRNQAHTVEHDYWVPGFSAGWIAGHEFGENFPNKPYLTPLQESVNVWKNLIKSEKIKVGIRWAGNPKFEHQQFRKFPVEFITNLAKYDELELYSLQRDHNTIQLPENVHDLQHFLMSWEDTLAAIANLDIVITSCTSIAHLAAAMGKKTWILVPILPYHTWTNGAPESNTSDYYECVELFRQVEPKKWNPTFQKLYKRLEEEFNLKHIDMPNEDKEYKKLNMGCGLNKQDGFLNVDRSDLVNPDQKVDLEVTPWPWKDNEFDHIVAQSILEHLGDTNEDFIDIIKEMYRVTENGGIWEIEVPHWRCDVALDDLTHKRLVTIGMFHLFNNKRLFERAKLGGSDSLLAFEHDVDIEVLDVQMEYTPPFIEAIKNKTMDGQQLNHALNHMNNVALSTKILIQVHKPGRIDKSEILKLNN
jgi:hypothetical protein